MDVEILSRIQFAFTVAVHYIFPPISIGLGLILVIMEGLYLKTKNPLYHDMTRFWVKVFALVFGIGVATGIVMEFEFGTNWATYSRFVGDIFGSALAAEGVFAFFLESGFLAVLVFGWDKVSPKMHFFSTIMVALGSTFSAVWIVVANSWQQTPAGYRIVTDRQGGPRAEITDFWAMVFNPSSMERLAHVVVGAWIMGAFFVMSVSAYYLLKRRHVEFAKASMKIAMAVGFVVTLIQPLVGHTSAVGVAKNQPAKLAAFEGHYDSTKPMDLTLLGWVDEASGRAVGLSVPGGASWLIHQDAGRPMTGLNTFAEADRPPVQMSFQFYHVMIACGFAMIGIMLVTAALMKSGKLWTADAWLKVLIVSVMIPQIANQTGWFAAEIGRQPWIVYNLLRTSDGLSKSVQAHQVLTSLILFGLVYLLLLALFIYLLDRKIKIGPTAEIVAAPRGL